MTSMKSLLAAWQTCFSPAKIFNLDQPIKTLSWLIALNANASRSLGDPGCLQEKKGALPRKHNWKSGTELSNPFQSD